MLGSLLQIDNYDKAMGKITQVFNERNILNAGYLFSNDRKVNAPTAAPGAWSSPLPPTATILCAIKPSMEISSIS